MAEVTGSLAKRIPSYEPRTSFAVKKAINDADYIPNYHNPAEFVNAEEFALGHSCLSDAFIG